MKLSPTLVLTLFLAACGGGGDDGIPPAPPLKASPGGVWFGVDSDGDPVSAFVTETGRFHIIDEFNIQGTGVLAVSNVNHVESTFQMVTPAFGVTFADGSTLADCTFLGTVNERVTLMGIVDCTTANGQQISTTVTLDYSDVYDRDSSIAVISGNWQDSVIDVLTIDANGAIFWQGSFSGCVTTGQANAIDLAYNTYDIELNFANCLPPVDVFNGSTFIGIGIADDRASPEQLVFRLIGEVDGDLASIGISFGRL